MNREQEVIDLLGKLRDAGPEYPSHLHSQRRAAVLASLAVVPVAATGLMSIAWVARLIKMIKAMAFVDKIILGVEVAAITGLTGYGAVTAYQYRYELQALIFPNSVSTPFPTLSVPSTLAVGGSSGGAGSEAATPSATPTGTPTPFATWTGLPGLPTQPEPATVAPLVPTAAPKQPTVAPAKPTPTRGKHLGQTETPPPKRP